MGRIYVTNHVLAYKEYARWMDQLTDAQRAKVESAVVAPDLTTKEWCVQGGDDLFSGHSGWGPTPSEAVRDFLTPFIPDLESQLEDSITR